MNVTNEHNRVLVRGGQAHNTVVRALAAHDTRHLTGVRHNWGGASVVVTPLSGQVRAALAFHDFLDLAGSLAYCLPHGRDSRTVHIGRVVASKLLHVQHRIQGRVPLHVDNRQLVAELDTVRGLAGNLVPRDTTRVKEDIASLAGALTHALVQEVPHELTVAAAESARARARTVASHDGSGKHLTNSVRRNDKVFLVCANSAQEAALARTRSAAHNKQIPHVIYCSMSVWRGANESGDLGCGCARVRWRRSTAFDTQTVDRPRNCQAYSPRVPARESMIRFR